MKDCIDCHECGNYEIESEGKWSFGICGIDRSKDLDPETCDDFCLISDKTTEKGLILTKELYDSFRGFGH